MPVDVSTQSCTASHATELCCGSSATGLGLSSDGTEAIGELLNDTTFLRQLLQKSPGNWKTVNLEAVIQTQVVEGHPGPSQVLAVEFW